MANKVLYKFVNPGMASDDDTPASLVAKKQTLAINQLGRSLSSMGGIVKDIESIELARVKNDKLRDKLERRRAQRERDQEAEDATEMRNLNKKDSKPSKQKVKSWLGKAGKSGKFLKDQLPLWAKMMQPIVAFIARLFTIAVIKEGLEWFADEGNREKVETFLHKINVVFTKLGNFSNWLFKEKLQGGWEKLTGKEKTFGQRMSGLWDLVQGVATIGMLTSPLGMLAAITGWIGNFIHNKPWQNAGANGRRLPKTNNANRGPLKRSRKTPTTSGGKSTGKAGGLREWWRKNNPFRRKATVTTGKGGLNKQGLGNWLHNVTKKGNNFLEGIKNSKQVKQVVSGAKGAFSNVTNKLPWFKTAITKGSNLLKSPAAKRALGSVKGAAGPVVNTLLAGMTLKGRLDKGQDFTKAATGTAAEVGGAWAGFGAGASLTGSLVSPMAAVPPWGTAAAGVLTLAGGVTGAVLGKEGMGRLSDTVVDNIRKENKAWWDPLGAFTGTHKAKPQEMFLGGIVKGISKAVSGVVKGVGKAVSGVVKGVTSIASNPIIGTALSFIPGMQIPMAIINGVGALQQGNIMGALSAGLGGLGAFANINTVNAISQPQWLQNLRFSGFGQGVANMYHSGAAAFGRLTTGWNNFMGSDLGKLGKGVFTGLSGGGWGGAMSQFGSMTGMTKPGGIFGEGGFFGAGGRMAGMGDWLQKHNLAGIGNMFPGLSGLANSIPGLANLPGISDLFAGQFSPAEFIGGVAERNGMGGLYKSAMGLLGGGDLYTGLKEISGELGISPEVFGAVDQGKSLYERAKKHALNPDPVELLPILVPIIKDQVVMAPAVKEKAVIYLDAAQSMMNRV